jgi:hypothetical protein
MVAGHGSADPADPPGTPEEVDHFAEEKWHDGISLAVGADGLSAAEGQGGPMAGRGPGGHAPGRVRGILVRRFRKFIRADHRRHLGLAVRGLLW